VIDSFSTYFKYQNFSPGFCSRLHKSLRQILALQA
jgi:hypothetical protein